MLWCLMYDTYMHLLCCHLQVFSNSSSCVFLEKKWFSLHWSQTPKPILSMCQGDLQWMNRYIVRPSSIFFSFLNVKKDAWWHNVKMWLRVMVGNKFLAKFPWSKEYPLSTPEWTDPDLWGVLVDFSLCRAWEWFWHQIYKEIPYSCLYGEAW